MPGAPDRFRGRIRTQRSLGDSGLRGFAVSGAALVGRPSSFLTASTRAFAVRCPADPARRVVLGEEFNVVRQLQGKEHPQIGPHRDRGIPFFNLHRGDARTLRAFSDERERKIAAKTRRADLFTDDGELLFDPSGKKDGTGVFCHIKRTYFKVAFILLNIQQPCTQGSESVLPLRQMKRRPRNFSRRAPPFDRGEEVPSPSVSLNQSRCQLRTRGSHRRGGRRNARRSDRDGSRGLHPCAGSRGSCPCRDRNPDRVRNGRRCGCRCRSRR